MKLRNKKTGEIGNLVLNINPNRESYSVLSTENGDAVCGNLVIADYNSLAELNAEWEDYEEPKEYWFINSCGAVELRTEEEQPAVADMHKQFGNYFETKEEAEKAVEKLKAWKRLKDKGFRFTGINDDEDSQELITQCGILCEADIYHLEKDADFLLIFGGEE